MLKEKTVYREELPVNVIVADVEEYPAHYHSDIEILYVLSGSIALKSGYYKYTLRQGDIFVVNANEIHSFNSTGESNMVMMLIINTEYFSNYYENLKDCFFMTDTHSAENEKFEVLRKILGKVMMEIIQKGYGHEEKVIEGIHNLLACLISDFRYHMEEDGTIVNNLQKRGDKILASRLNRITEYMHKNYKRKLTLNEIAENENLSIYYLSHVIKEATNLSFQELLSFIRVEESEKLLLETNKKIGAIAEETGFSAVRYYIKHFEIWFGMHPIDYRKKYAGKVVLQEIFAKYTRSTPSEIEDVVRRRTNSIYSDYMNTKRSVPIIVDLNFSKLNTVNGENKFMDRLLERDNMKLIARPYNLLRSLKETVIVSGYNYLITTAAIKGSDVSSMSILVYNLNEIMTEELMEVEAKEKILEKIKSFDEEMEFLVRGVGFSGKYKISRYKMLKENIIFAYEDAIRQQRTTAKRQAIINNWSTLPNVEFGQMTSFGTMSLRSTLSGVSAELILIDRVN